MTPTLTGVWLSLRNDIQAEIDSGKDPMQVLALAAGYAAFRGLVIDSDWLCGAGSYVQIFSADESDTNEIVVRHRDGKAVIVD